MTNFEEGASGVQPPENLPQRPPQPPQSPQPPLGAPLQGFNSTAQNYLEQQKKEQERLAGLRARVTTVKGGVTALVCLLLGWMFCETILFSGAGGVRVTCWVLAFYGALWYVFHEKTCRFDARTKLIAIPTVLLAGSFLLHYNPSTQWITTLMLIALLAAQLMLVGGVKTESIFSLDMLCKTVDSVVGGAFRNLSLPFYSATVLKKEKSKSATNALYVLAGSLLALPVGCILLSLFMEADELFSESASALLRGLFDFSPLRAIGVLFWGTVLGLLMSGCVLGLRYEQREQKTRGAVVGKVSGVVTGTFLTFIAALTVAFVGFQFTFLFGGPQDLTAYGLTYAKYARSGFFSLCQASGLLLAVVVLVLVFTKRAGERLPVYVRGLIVLLCLCDGVLLASAVKRMLLYVGEFDLSIKRLLTLWLMALIGVCLVGVVVKCVRDKSNLFRWIGVTAIVGVCVLSLANTERMVARYNVNQVLSNPAQNELDVYYLTDLSYTITPEVMRLAGSDKLNEKDFNDIIRHMQYSLKNHTGDRFYGFTLDSIAAQRLIDATGVIAS